MLSMTEHIYDSSTWETEAEGPWVWGQNRLYSETLSQKYKIKIKGHGVADKSRNSSILKNLKTSKRVIYFIIKAIFYYIMINSKMIEEFQGQIEKEIIIIL